MVMLRFRTKVLRKNMALHPVPENICQVLDLYELVAGCWWNIISIL